MADIQWTSAQWDMVNNAVTEAFGKASVAAAFLPCYGPLSQSAEYVRAEKFATTGSRVTITDDTTVKLFNLMVTVELSSEQVAEEALSSALLAFRRASSTLAQIEDHLVFNGRYKDAERAEERRKIYQGLQIGDNRVPELTDDQDRIVRKSSPNHLTGLIDVATAEQIQKSITEAKESDAEQLVAEVARSVVELENNMHPGPFACILGTEAFVAAYTPEPGGLVLPADRITPILNGPLLRSGQMPTRSGIVVSIATNAIDIVVATPPTVQFLQVNDNAKYIFRVYEKFTLRIKDAPGAFPMDHPAEKGGVASTLSAVRGLGIAAPPPSHPRRISPTPATPSTPPTPSTPSTPPPPSSSDSRSSSSSSSSLTGDGHSDHKA
jgi:uncharacterized linocin/CFP29 family protein